MSQLKLIAFKDSTLNRALTCIGIAFVLLTVCILISISSGQQFLSPIAVIQALLGKGTALNQFIVVEHRLPRILVACFVGAALAISGAILQGIIRNPLASPDIVGITGGASVGAVFFLAIYSGQQFGSIQLYWISLFAFVGAFIMAILVYFLSWNKGVSPIRLVLIGIGLTAATQAITTLFILKGPLYLATQATLWLTGSVYGSNWSEVRFIFIWLIIMLFILIFFIRKLNVQQLGDDVGKSLGSRMQLNRFALLMISTSLAAVAVALAGGISFLGLIAPHIARKLVGSAMERLIPLSAIIGAVILLIADLIARTAFLPLDLPAGIFTAAIGAPYFIYLLFTTK